MNVHIRWMIRRDMAKVLQIEHESFSVPWTEEDFLRCLRQRNCIGMVAEHGEKVVGYMLYNLNKISLEIINFAVAPHFRKSKVGQQMIEKLKGKLASHSRTRILTEVRETNLIAQKFLSAQGFIATYVIHHHYEDTDEDAYKFKFWLDEEESTSDFVEDPKEVEAEEINDN